LTTLNARYIHSALGLRYLLANMAELQSVTRLVEYDINQRPIDIVEALLVETPKIIGFGVYIWNVAPTTQVVALLKQVRPDIIVVLGGPEVSYEYADQAIVALADYTITGAADVSFYRLCQQILPGHSLTVELPTEQVIVSPSVSLSDIQFPYAFYTDDDIAHRVIYVEASRGCPFKCEFCLSALDKTSWPFALDAFLAQMQILYDRGARHFKFVDRTFNIKVQTSLTILDFFLARMDQFLFLHFEIIPDQLPDALKVSIAKFPTGSLQFEVGVQSFNPDVQVLISRKQNRQKTLENLHWLRQHSQAHIHVDLIIGLPGEGIESFADGFNQLVELNPHEIQIGILKRLRGTPIIRHTGEFAIKYNPEPPYNILQSALIDFNAMQRLTRFARYWDMIANSGNFQQTRLVILGNAPFKRFMQLSDWLFAETKQTHRISLKRLFDLIFKGITEVLGVESEVALSVLQQDFQTTGVKGYPNCLSPMALQHKRKTQQNKAASRQARHVMSG